MAAGSGPPRPSFLRHPPHFIAHRGGAGLAPENTLLAFRRAVELWHADMIELDVHASADGHCVAMHDDTVDRTTNGTGRVASMTLEELQRLDAGHRFVDPDGGRPFRGGAARIPTIGEVLRELPDTRFIVEVKACAAQRPLFDAVQREGAHERVLAASARAGDRTLFDRYPGPISASGDAMKRMYLLHRLHLIRWWRAGRASAVQMPLEHMGHRIVNARLVRELHEKGLVVHVWTVNEERDMRALFELGVDGILTDRPDRLARVMADLFGRPLPPGARDESGHRG